MKFSKPVDPERYYLLLVDAVFLFFASFICGSWVLTGRDLMHWWGFFHHVAFWNYFNFIGNSMLFLVLESWNSGVQTAGTCWAVGNGLQGQTVRRASWDGVWWAGIATWEEPEPTEENTATLFSWYWSQYIFILCFPWAKNICAVSSLGLVVFANLLWSSKWVTCSPFHLVCNVFSCIYLCRGPSKSLFEAFPVLLAWR